METSLKPGFAQIFSCCPKNLSCPKFGGGLQPPSPPPARTPMCLRKKKKERKPSDTLGIENNEWYQIKSEDGEGVSQTQHNEHNGSFLTCHSDKPTCSRNLPRRDNGSGGPHFLCGSGGGAQLLVDYIYFFLLSTEVWKCFFLISR